MSTLTIEVAEDIRMQIDEAARQQGVTADQILSDVVSGWARGRRDHEKLLAIQAKASKQPPGAWKELLSKLPDRPPLPGDELPPDLKEWLDMQKRRPSEAV